MRERRLRHGDLIGERVDREPTSEAYPACTDEGAVMESRWLNIASSEAKRSNLR
jgi:hypothetical protein